MESLDIARPAFTCEFCRNMISDCSTLDGILSEDGITLSRSIGNFRSSVDQKCSICVAFLEMANRGNFQEVEAFRVLETTTPKSQPDSVLTKLDRMLIWNVQATLRPGGTQHDIESVRVAAWSAANRYNFDVEFEVYAISEDPAAAYVSTRPINPTVASPTSYELANQWIDDCLRLHTGCPNQDVATLPTRVIEVGYKDSSKSPRLYVSHGLQDRYAALSYCWGGPQPVMLTTSTAKSMAQGIEISTLPRTIQDAIKSTRMLGLRFIWIDALCIFQDSSVDKDLEIAKMSSIYQNAHVTICAASARACGDGFLEVRSNPDPWLAPVMISQIIFPCLDGVMGSIFLKESRLYYPTTEPLNKRAWALQERLLSPRVLTYGSRQMFWHCQSAQYCDGGDINRFDKRGVERLVSGIMGTSVGLGKETNDSLLWGNWVEIVEEYAGRKLTEHTDKLPALSGIATKFQQALGDTFCAGLWKSQLQKGLAWQVGEPRICRPPEYRAPTWSWAALNGETFWLPDGQIIDSEMAKGTRILKCEVLPISDLAPYGKVKSGTIRISGLMKEIDWDGAEQVTGPEGDVEALAKVDVAEETVYFECDDESGKPNTVEPVTFYMGRDQEGVNKVLRPACCLLITDICALLLERQPGQEYIRLGLMEFESQEAMEKYFEGCRNETVTIK